MPSAVDQRLASLFHLTQIERFLRIERIADDAERLVRQTFRAIVQAGATPSANPSPHVAALLRQLPQALNHLLADRYLRLANYAHSSTVECYAKGIPRRWMRLVSPGVIRAGEAVTEDARIDLGPGVAEISDFLADPPEPVIDGSHRMDDAEWAKFLEENLFPPPPPEKVEQIILRPVDGVSWPQRVQALSRLVQDPGAVARTLRDGYAAGETLDQLSRRVKPLADNFASSAKRIARTEGSRIAEQVQRETYDSLGDLMAGLQIIATLDERTRPAHRLWHGRIYWKEGRKKPSIEEFPDLPAGPNCRCTSVPVLKPPKEFENDPAVRAEFQNASGDTIPDPSAYSDWFRQADRGRRILAVGAKRYQTVQRLLGGREPEWKDFIDADGNLLSVSQLQGEKQRTRDARVAKVSQVIADRMNLLGQVSRYGFVSKMPPEGRPRKNAAAKKATQRKRRRT